MLGLAKLASMRSNTQEHTCVVIEYANIKNQPKPFKYTFT